MALLPLSYFPPIEHLSIMAQNNHVQFEIKEHFVKKSTRNRCSIQSANGDLLLSVPIELKSREKTLMENIKIAQTEEWQSLHWKSIVSAYQSAPFFEHYEEKLSEIFLSPFEQLKDLNLASVRFLLDAFKLDTKIEFTQEFLSPQAHDWRFTNKNTPSKTTFPRYIQVFEDKHGFMPNLSALDLLFNEGPYGIIYLKQLQPTLV